MLIECDNPKEVAEEAFWLAWDACGRPTGMGVFQDRPGATKEEVLANARGRGDYPGGSQGRKAEEGKLYGDYVFGRMMKLHLAWTDRGVEAAEIKPRWDYQSWSAVYPTYEALVRAAIEGLKKEKN